MKPRRCCCWNRNQSLPAGISRIKSLGVIAVLALVALPAFGYLLNFTMANDNSPQPDRWDFGAFPVTWSINPTKRSNIQGSRSVTEVMKEAFNTWITAPNAAVQPQFAGAVPYNQEKSAPPNINLICFVCADADFTQDAQTLAVTITTTANGPGQNDGHGGMTRFAGQLLKADIIFNPNSGFDTDAGDGQDIQDLQTVATHEIGHFLGLGHSAVVRAVMFPSASTLRTLAYDDVAGLSLLYPSPNPSVATGSISGAVRLFGTGVFGAHVYAESVADTHPFASTIRKTPVGTLSRPDGSYSIEGLPPDSYQVYAEPLDGPVEDGDIHGYANAFGKPSVQTNFTTRAF